MDIHRQKQTKQDINGQKGHKLTEQKTETDQNGPKQTERKKQKKTAQKHTETN